MATDKGKMAALSDSFPEEFHKNFHRRRTKKAKAPSAGAFACTAWLTQISGFQPILAWSTGAWPVLELLPLGRRRRAEAAQECRTSD